MAFLSGVPHKNCFIVSLPASSDHSGHAVYFKGGLSQRMYKRLSEKIKELVTGRRRMESEFCWMM